MSDTLVVTGANGFIGQHLLRAILSEGRRTIALVRKPRSLSDFTDLALSVHRWRLEDAVKLKALIPKGSILCHLAAYIPLSYDDARTAMRCMKVNAAGTAALLEAAASAGVRHFIYLAAGNAYCPSIALARESDCVYPSARAPFYLASKLAGEIFVHHYALRKRLDVTILRVSSPYGFGMRRNSIVAAFLHAAIENRPLEILDGGNSPMDLVFVNDVVNAILLAIKTQATGTFNIGSGESVSSSELARRIIQVASPRLPLLTVKHSPPTDVCAERPAFPSLDISLAKSVLGYFPTPLNDGLTEFTRQLRTQS
jgi:UDP-glucose 4-epimerase